MPTPYAFSANTGFLYPELPFLARIRAAARDGFEAVEFHDEGQSVDRAQLLDVLAETGLPVAGLNVRMGPSAGCAAIPGERDRARREFDDAARLADDVDAGAIHVLAGKTDDAAARDAFIDTLRYALSASDRTLLIEPLCSLKMPDYWLNSLDVAAGVIDEIGDARLTVLFDCFHIETEHGDTLARFRATADRVGHVQIASVPARAEPAIGSGDDLDYATLLPAFQAAGYGGRFGCEYEPTAGLDAPLAWLARLRESLPSA